MKSDLGGIYSLNLAGQPMIVVNSVKIARELLGLCSSSPIAKSLLADESLERASMSDRPHNIMTNDLLCDSHFVAFAPYGAM